MLSSEACEGLTGAKKKNVYRRQKGLEVVWIITKIAEKREWQTISEQSASVQQSVKPASLQKKKNTSHTLPPPP